MLVVAIANRKGGTGKTTTAVNLAAEMATRGLKTLLIDLDTQGHASFGLGFRETAKIKYFSHTIFEAPDFDLSKAIYQTNFENLFLSPANTHFVNRRGEFEELRLSKALTICNEFDRIIIDTPPTLDLCLITALCAAHAIIIPFLPHFLAAIGVKQMSRLFYQTATRYNQKLKLLGLVPVMYDRRLNMHKEVIKEVTNLFGSSRILRGIRSNVRLAEAFNAGKPIRYFAPKSIGAMDYYLLCEEIEMLCFAKNR